MYREPVATVQRIELPRITLKTLEARGGFEPPHKGFADLFFQLNNPLYFNKISFSGVHFGAVLGQLLFRFAVLPGPHVSPLLKGTGKVRGLFPSAYCDRAHNWPGRDGGQRVVVQGQD